MEQKNIRNFSIVAHIDHGKSTLADRFLEQAGTLDPRKKRDQLMDNMELERERGITIKAKAVRLVYAQAGREYQLNLIDTPGHVDFSYEVSRSLKACEGVLLLVDATQGIEAQTLAHAYLSLEEDLDIIPVINKIDMRNADVGKVRSQLVKIFGFKEQELIETSAKQGDGVEATMRAVVERVRMPGGDAAGPLRALVFDSSFDFFRGVVIFIRMVDGEIREGQEISFYSSGISFKVDEVGIFTPERKRIGRLAAGEVGYFIAGIKDPRQAQVGDTVCEAKQRPAEPLPGYREIKPVVFCGLYPQAAEDYGKLKDALDRLRLSDAALSYQAESSQALSFGFRCGFLGKLHMEITIERLEREHDLDLIATTPSVIYKITKGGKEWQVQNPADFPEISADQEIHELYIEISVITPVEYMSPIIDVLKDRRGTHRRTEFLDPERVLLVYEVPLAEVVIDFYDRLKSMSRGYASMDYTPLDYRLTQVVKVDILINKERVEAFSFICHRDKARRRSKAMVEKLSEIIPRHMFAVPIQAAIGGEIIARTNVKAMRKDVTSKCYGGDITRKRKLLERQKKGKKKMQSIGQVEVPKEAFLAALKLEE